MPHHAPNSHPTSHPQPHWLHAKSIPLPKLPDSFKDPAAHDRLLADYLDWSGNFPALAQKHGLDFDTFDRWVHSDIIQARLKRVRDIADLRAFTAAKLARSVALSRLVEVIESRGDSTPKDRVRAAAEILKTAARADDDEKAQAKLSAKAAPKPEATLNRKPLPHPTAAPRLTLHPEPLSPRTIAAQAGSLQPIMTPAPTPKSHRPNAGRQATATPPRLLSLPTPARGRPHITDATHPPPHRRAA